MSEDYIDLITSIRQWRVRLEGALLDCGVLGREPITSLVLELDGYIEVLDDPTISQNLNNFTLTKMHPIDKLGCGLVVTRLYEQGASEREISKQISTYTNQEISEEEVSSWLSEYQSSPISQRKGKVNSSIFDTANQLENLAVRLTQLMTLVEREDDQIFAAGKTTRWNVILEYQKEMRATVKDASAIIKAIHEMNTMKELAMVIVEEIGQVDPRVQRAIFSRLRERSVMFKALGI